jgi:hypothetical protein
MLEFRLPHKHPVCFISKEAVDKSYLQYPELIITVNPALAWLQSYAGILVLHFGSLVFFLPEDERPLPVGTKTGFLATGLITFYALSSTWGMIGSVNGFLSFFFTLFMEILWWISIIVFAFIIKSVSVVEAIGGALAETDWPTVDTTGRTYSNSDYSDGTDTDPVDNTTSTNTNQKNTPKSVTDDFETNEYGEIKEKN